MPKTYAEQVAETLRKELEQGRWTGIMPGRDRLAGELEVNARTVDGALTMRENEGCWCRKALVGDAKSTAGNYGRSRPPSG